MEFVDQTGYRFERIETPNRIISIVPSQTELLFDLGLDERVVGITKFCVHPQSWFENKERVGGTKNLKLERIKVLRPDLILANKEENSRQDIEYLRQYFPVYTSDISSLNDSLNMILDVGKLTETESKALELVRSIWDAFNEIKPFSGKNRRVVYLIWQEPLMSVGRSTFIHDMLERCGFDNILGGLERYPELNLAQLNALSPDFLFLSTEPFPFQEKHLAEWLSNMPDTQPVLVDGEYFSWYGSRLQKAPGYFVDLINKIS